MNGINVGGWLVTEPWVTPSLYKTAHDEFTLTQTAEGDVALEHHYKTFITHKDFAWIAEQGFEVIRLPVGYGVFGDAEPYNKTINYVDQAFKWAQKYGLKILLDLHTAVGSQNGNDHSGKRGTIAWHTDSLNIESTIQTVDKLAHRYANSDQLWGIELLNEPSREIPRKTLELYYRRAYDAVRESCDERVAVVICELYRPIAEWEHLLNDPLIKNMLIDVHLYQVFNPKDKNLTLDQHIAKALRWQRMLQAFGPEKVIVGEWSSALHETYDQFSANATEEARKLYCQAQQFAFANTAGHFYWNYKNEHPGPWSYRSLKTK